MKILKRNGQEVSFDCSKIEIAITKANQSVLENQQLTTSEIQTLTNEIKQEITKKSTISGRVKVEEIQDIVETHLMKTAHPIVAKNYIKYRFQRELARKKNSTDDTILSLIDCQNEDIKEENSNKNPTIVSVQRDYMAGEVSKDLTRRVLLPEKIVEAHDKGVIHFHDMDYYAQRMYNCCLVNLEDMLQNGTVISGTMIETPHSFATACNIATQVIAQVASSQYGGQTITLSHLAPFVDVSRQKIYKQVVEELQIAGIEATQKEIIKIVEVRLLDEIRRGVQTIQYQVITLQTTNGQAPFITMFMYLNEVQDPQTKEDLALLIEEVLRQRMVGIKNEQGIYITPAFPKLIYVLQENNIHETSPYYYLTKLAAQCSAKRLVPDYISEKIMKEYKVDANGNGQCYPAMGCRSFLTPYLTPLQEKPKYYGRFNCGVVTINLVDVALSSQRNLENFWKLLEERTELCHEALQLRHKRLRGVVSDVAPILWQNGGIARLKKGETIDELLFNGYSTLSLGYAGLYECICYLTGKSHTAKENEEISKKVMQFLNDQCTKWKLAEHIDYSVYGTPLESTTYKFARTNREKFGVIENVTDRNYITNSYHVHVTEEINAFDKLSFEAKFQKLSPGGAISYVEVPNLQSNIEAALSVIRFIYDHIMYAELNTKSDYCMKCGFNGEIQIVENEGKKLEWKCPHCGNTDQNQMSVARRTCGYIGTQFWNQGRTAEIKDRVLHL